MRLGIGGGSTSVVTKAFGGPRASTAAMEGDDPRLNPMFNGQFVRPRFVPGTWMQYLELSTRLTSCIHELATASVGLGVRGIPDPFELELLGPEEENPAKNRRNALLDAARELTRFCHRPNSNSWLPLSHELLQAEIDYLGSGNAYLEIAEENREAGGRVLGLAHVRCALMRTDRDRTKWVKGVSTDTYDNPQSGTFTFNGRFFRVYGDPDPRRKFIDKFTGEFFSTWPKDRPEAHKGTAIIHAKSYNPLDEYYGSPAAAPALKSIIENDLQSKFMLQFLKGGTHVPILVIVEGGNLTPESSEKVEALFASDGQGVENAGRAAVIEPKISGLVGQSAKIRVERIELGLKDLSPLLERRNANVGEILEAFRMSGVFIGGGEGGQATSRNASVLKQLSFEHAIEPRTSFWEALLSASIAPHIAKGAVFHARRPKNLDPLQVASILQKLKDGLNVRDIRGALRMLIDGIELPVLQVEDQDLPLGLRPVEVADRRNENALDALELADELSADAQDAKADNVRPFKAPSR